MSVSWIRIRIRLCLGCGDERWRLKLLETASSGRTLDKGLGRTKPMPETKTGRCGCCAWLNQSMPGGDARRRKGEGCPREAVTMMYVCT